MRRKILILGVMGVIIFSCRILALTDHISRRVRVDYNNVSFTPDFIQSGINTMAKTLAFIEQAGVNLNQLADALDIRNFFGLIEAFDNEISEEKYSEILSSLQFVPPPSEWLRSVPLSSPEDYNDWLELARQWYDYLNDIPKDKMEELISEWLTFLPDYDYTPPGPNLPPAGGGSEEPNKFPEGDPRKYFNKFPIDFNSIDVDLIASFLEAKLFEIIKNKFNIPDIDYTNIKQELTDSNIFWKLANKISTFGIPEFKLPEDDRIRIENTIREIMDFLKDTDQIPPTSEEGEDWTESVEIFTRQLMEEYEERIASGDFVPEEDRELLNLADIAFETAQDFEDKDLFEAIEKYSLARKIYQALTVRQSLPQSLRKQVEERLRVSEASYNLLLGVLRKKFQSNRAQWLQNAFQKIDKEAIKDSQLAQEILIQALTDYNPEVEEEEIQKLRLAVAARILGETNLNIDRELAESIVGIGRKITLDKTKSEDLRRRGLYLWMGGIEKLPSGSSTAPAPGVLTRDDKIKLLLVYLKSPDTPAKLIDAFLFRAHKLIRGSSTLIMADMIEFALEIIREGHWFSRDIAKAAIQKMLKEMSEEDLAYIHRRFPNLP